MSFTDKFRVQHDEILALATEITNDLQGLTADPVALRKKLSNLTGKVNFHLAMEDKALYPRLMDRKGTPAQVTASKFQKEMGGLAKVFTDYASKWQLDVIRSDKVGFQNETRKVFGALAHRISRETRELYPLADQSS